MKKLITIILVLALIIPAAAMSDFDKAPYLGNWAGIQHFNLSGYDTILHYLFITDSGISIYTVTGMVRNAGITPAAAETYIYRSKWEALDAGMRIYTSETTYFDIYFDQSGNLLSDSPMIMFAKLN